MTVESYTIADYLNAFRRRSRLFIVSAVVIASIGAAIAISLPDVYRSITEMRIDLQGPNVGTLEPIAMTNYADQYVKSLQQKVLTYDNLRSWLEASDLYADEREDLTTGQLVNKMLDGIRVNMVVTTVTTPSGNGADLITGFTASFDAPEPEGAHFVADKIAQGFLAEDRATRTQKASTALTFLQTQIQQKQEEIAGLEARMADFKEENAGSLPDLRALNMSVLERTETELRRVEDDLRTAKQDRIFRQSQLDEIRRSSPSADRLADLEAEYLRAISIYGPDHPDVIRIRRQIAALTGGGATVSSVDSTEIAQLEAELAAAQQRYSDVHPDVVSLKRRLQVLREQQQGSAVDSETANPEFLQLTAQINALDTQIDGLEQRQGELRDKIEETQNRIARTPQVERDFLALTRDLQTAQLAFDDLRQRLAQAQQTESFEAGDTGARLEQVRSPGTPERPAGPPRLAIFAIGLFLATTLATALALGAEVFDSTIRGARDVRSLLQVKPIVSVPIMQNSVARSLRRRRIVYLSLGVTVIIAALIMTLVGQWF